MTRATQWWIGLASVGGWLLLDYVATPSSAVAFLGPPVDGNATPLVTPHGYFGAPRDGPPRHTHQGLDLAAKPGSHVLAVGDGQIVQTDPGLGKIVRKLRLDAPGNWAPSQHRVNAIVYADLGKPLARAGDRVHKGQPIALVDKAGFVHFAVKEFQPHGEVFFDPKEAGFVYRAWSDREVT